MVIPCFTGSCCSSTLYLLDIDPVEHALISSAPASLETWHKCLSHISLNLILAMAKSGMVSGMPTNLSLIPSVCEHCILGKQTKHSVPKLQMGERKQCCLKLIYADLTSLEDVPAGGKYYSLTLIDDFSHYT
jgi:hypothetical protein